MFDFSEATKEMSAIEILNYYRNLYYAEPQVTERGIILENHPEFDALATLIAMADGKEAEEKTE